MLDGPGFLSQLLEKLDARSGEVFCHYYRSAGDRLTVTFAELEARLAERNRAIADQLPVGSLLLVIEEDPLEQVLWWLAALIAGVVPGILTPPTPKLDPERYARQLEATLSTHPTAGLAVGRDLAHWVPDGALSVGRLSGQGSGESGSLIVRSRPPSSPLLFQESSGTTGLRKGILLGEEAVVAQLEAYGEAIALRADDVIVSWLPLYHDMGLIACLAQATYRCIPLVLASPFTWLHRPAWLFEAVTAHRGTMTWLPNFAFNLMADRVPAGGFAADALASLRLVVSCSEPVKPDSVVRFADAFAAIGLQPGALASSYAMAETVFAVTQSPPGEEIVIETVDPAGLREGRAVRVAEGTRVASSGRPIADTEVRIGEGGGGDGDVGEIFVRSGSLMSGYFGTGETENPIESGWLRTGDLGFRFGDEVFVVGRIKDVIIRAGRNYDPGELEAAATSVDGVKPGRAVAFGLPNQAEGTEDIVVVAEFAGTIHRDPPSITADVFERLAEAGVQAQRVEIVRPGWLAKSSSGKIARAACRDRYAAMLERRKAPMLVVNDYGENLPEELKDSFASFGLETRIPTPTEIQAPGRISLGNWVSLGRYGKLLMNTDFSRIASYARQHYGDVDHDYDPVVYGPRNPTLVIDDGVQIGDSFFISCARSIRIGKHVMISARVFIADSNHLVENLDLPISVQSNSLGTHLEIGDHSWVGVNCCILEGARIGRHAVVSAGSVVTGEVPDYAVVAGNPARIVRMLSDRGTTEERVSGSADAAGRTDELVVAHITEFVGRKGLAIGADDRLLDAGVLDSLEVLLLLSSLEERLEATIDERLLWERKPTTVREFAAGVTAVLGS